MTHSPAPSTHAAKDALWAGELLRANLDLWLTASAQPSGLFYPFLDRQWQRMAPAPLTLVSQCRLIYNFSRGYESWQSQAYADAAQAGVAALQRFFAVSPGRWRWSVTPNGAAQDDTPDAYGHAFCVLALATAGRVLGEPSWVSDAWQTGQYVQSALADPAGGLLWRLTGPEAFAVNPRSQNPLMHSFEALMALHAAAPDGRALGAAHDVLAFAHELAGFDTGALTEDYTATWQPQTLDKGGLVKIGHVFEWAWLLSEWHALTSDPEALAQGLRFLEIGMAWGLDTSGSVRDSCTPDGRVVDAAPGLWPQCEAVRALCRYAARHGQAQCETPLRNAGQFYRTHFLDGNYGGVFAEPARADGSHSQIKGDAWKLDYHTLGMCLELMDTRSAR